MPEVSSLEKVEVLKGSAALLFGNVAPGGILNMVTKKPSFKSGGEISMQMGEDTLFPKVRATDVNTIISAAGTSCRHQILDGTGREVHHPVTILKSCLKQ